MFEILIVLVVLGVIGGLVGAGSTPNALGLWLLTDLTKPDHDQPSDPGHRP